MSDKATSALSDRLGNGEAQVLADWAAALPVSLRSQMSDEELQAELGAMYRAFLDGLRSGESTKGAAFDELRALLTELSITRARRGFSPTETVASIFALKTVLVDLLDAGGDPVFVDLSAKIDELGMFTFERFVAAREAVIVNQSAQLMELSTPVVKLWEGVLAVPLVGTLDSARTQVVMETLLQMLVDTGSAHAIIDITGVAAVDTQVAQHLLKTVVAARLMGAECMISGISPQIAQTVVALGIEFGDIPTKATLADALRHVLGQAGYEVVRRGERAC